MPQQVQNLPAVQETQEMRIQSLGQEDPREKETAAHSSIFTGRSQGQRSLVGCGPKDRKDLDMTEQLSAYTLWCTCILPGAYVCIYTSVRGTWRSLD